MFQDSHSRQAGAQEGRHRVFRTLLSPDEWGSVLLAAILAIIYYYYIGKYRMEFSIFKF